MMHKFRAAILGLGLTLSVSCGKKTLNPALESRARLNTTNEAAAVAAVTVDPATTSDPTISELQDLINKERDERLAADADLQQQIDNLHTTLNLVFASLNDDIARLDRLALDSQTKLLEYQRLADKKIADLEAKLADANVEGLRIELRESIARIEKELADYKNYAASTFATKVELQALNTLVMNLSGLLNDLDDEVSDLSAWRQRLETTTIPALQTQIDDLVASLRLNQENDDKNRLALQNQINALLTAIQALQSVVNTQAALIAANAREIEQVRQSYDRLQTEFRTELTSLRSDVNTRIEQVRQESIAMTAALGTQMQQQFAEINTRIGTTHQTITASVQLIIEHLITVIGSLGSQTTSTSTSTSTATGTSGETTTNTIRDQLLAALKPEIEDLSKSFSELAYDRVLVEFDIVNFIAPFSPAPGVNSTALNSSFRDLIIAQACDGFLGDSEVAAMSANREWFMHMAGEYAILFAGNIRTGNTDIDRIYYGVNPSLPASSTIGYSLIAGSLLKSYSADDPKSNCRTSVKDWARRQILGDTAQAVALRKAIVESTKLQERTRILNTHLISFINRAAVFETRLVDILASAFNRSAADIQMFLTTAVNDVRPVDTIVKYLIDIHGSYAAIAEASASRDRIFLLAKNVAALNATVNNGGITVAELNTLYENLKLRVDVLANSVRNIQISINNLTSNQADTFRFLATLAGRLGFADLVLIANNKAIEISGTQTAGNFAPTSCYAVQHFYNHATTAASPVSRCDSSITLFDKMLADPEQTRCAIHGVSNISNNFYGHSWGNLFPIRNPQLFTEWGQSIGNGLKIYGYEPTETKAKQLANRPDGASYPSDGETTLVYRVLGNAEKLRFDVVSETSDTSKRWPYSVTVNAADFLKGSTGQINIYEVPLPRAISQLGACTWNRQVTVTAIAADNTASGQVCKHRFHTFSPIVLNLAGKDMVKTIPPTESKVWFDLDGNGIQERTGWISGDVAFLARDINQNGIIDDGKELFGEATQLGSKKAENGYKALSYFDDNHDQELDARDRIFSELLVWKDMNRDGISQPYELRTVRDLGITRISTHYKSVPGSEQLQADKQRVEGNLVKYQSRFYMPSCGQDGCGSFDVYFGSSEYTSVGL